MNPIAIQTCFFLIAATILCHTDSGFSQDRRAQENQTTFVTKSIEGWSVKIDSVLLDTQKETGDRAIKALANHLQRIQYILPDSKLKALQKLPICVEFKNDGLSNMQYHPSKGWLLRNGQNPDLAKHVHIPVASELFAKNMWAKHPYVILHELAHAYHDQVLGFQHQQIKNTFELARKKGIYNRVLDHRGVLVKHYGMNNEKEYFAECTEAYLGVNDFYPFVRAELKRHDPECFQLMETIWGKIR